MANGWELFEFVYDQWFGGDAQHWNYYRALEEAAENNQKLFWLIPLDNFSEEDRILRFAIMDTMGDMILNVIGAVPTFRFAILQPTQEARLRQPRRNLSHTTCGNTKRTFSTFCRAENLRR